MAPVRIKICCIASQEEARLAINSGASAIGLVGRMPSGPGPIDDELINAIARSIPPPIATFLLTSETSADSIVAHHARTQTNTIQIVDRVSPDTHRELRCLLPAVRIVQVIHIVDDFSVDEALAASRGVDALLLDSGNPDLGIKQLGGTGRTHNWQLSRRIVDRSRVPVFLAGGLNPSNVREAIETVRPFGIDVCSGVRTTGALDPQKLDAFFSAVHSP